METVQHHKRTVSDAESPLLRAPELPRGCATPVEYLRLLLPDLTQGNFLVLCLRAFYPWSCHCTVSSCVLCSLPMFPKPRPRACLLFLALGSHMACLRLPSAWCASSFRPHLPRGRLKRRAAFRVAALVDVSQNEEHSHLVVRQDSGETETGR